MTTPTELLARLSDAVERYWGEPLVGAMLIDGGMNSITIGGSLSSGRVVAKWVSALGREDLIRGAEVARAMSDHGIRAGRPLLTSLGQVTAPLLDGELAVLDEVTGEPLSNSAADQWDWGAALARVHSMTSAQEEGSMFFPWLRENGLDPARESWVRRIVEDLLGEYVRLGPLIWAQLHTDPEPEAFRRDANGDIGVIDWSGSIRGPVLYDVASAVMYAGGESAAGQLIAGYQSRGLLPDSELRSHLRYFRQFRGAVQAVYFSKRLHDEDLTGIVDQEENANGLRDSLLILRDAGIRVSES
jgi:Ser/Thr protein kinase RdoA (MazF antagonist)